MFERRKAQRFAVGWPIKIEGNDIKGRDFKEACKLENLSSAGAFINLDRSLQVGEKLNVSIKVPFKRESWMKYSAEVIRIEGDHDKFHAALRFYTFRPTFIAQ